MTSHRSPSGRYYDWPMILAKLRANPGRWSVRLNDEPHRLLRTVRERSTPELHLEGGVVEAHMVNKYTDSRGRKRGDVYLRYMPTDARLPSEEV